MAKGAAFWAFSILVIEAFCFSAKADGSKVNVVIQMHQKVQSGQTVKVVGNADELYNWDYETAPGLTRNRGNQWILNTQLTKGKIYYYKAIVVDSQTSKCDCWQSGNNTELTIPSDFKGVYLLHVVWNPNARSNVDACSVGDDACASD